MTDNLVEILIHEIEKILYAKKENETSKMDSFSVNVNSDIHGDNLFIIKFRQFDENVVDMRVDSFVKLVVSTLRCKILDTTVSSYRRRFNDDDELKTCFEIEIRIKLHKSEQNKLLSFLPKYKGVPVTEFYEVEVVRRYEKYIYDPEKECFVHDIEESYSVGYDKDGKRFPDSIIILDPDWEEENIKKSKKAIKRIEELTPNMW